MRWRRLVMITEGPTDVDALSLAISAILTDNAYGYKLLNPSRRESEDFLVKCINYAFEGAIGLYHILRNGRYLCFIKDRRDGSQREGMTVIIGNPGGSEFSGYSGALEALRIYMNTFKEGTDIPTAVVAVIDGDVVKRQNRQSNLEFLSGRIRVRKGGGSEDRETLAFKCRTVVCETDGRPDEVPGFLFEVTPLREEPRGTMFYIMVSGVCNKNDVCKRSKYEIELFEAVLVIRIADAIQANDNERDICKSIKPFLGREFLRGIPRNRRKCERQEFRQRAMEAMHILLRFKSELVKWCEDDHKSVHLLCEGGCCNLKYFSPLAIAGYLLGHKDLYTLVYSIFSANSSQERRRTREAIIEALKDCNMYMSLKRILDVLHFL